MELIKNNLQAYAFLAIFIGLLFLRSIWILFKKTKHIENKNKKKPSEHEFRRLINDMSMTLFYCHYILSETCHRANCIVAYFKVDNNPVTSLCISRNGNFC